MKNSEKIIKVEPRYISPSAYSARRRFDEYELLALRDSIAQIGIINPLCVREAGGGRYFLVSGERRLIAAKMAGLKKVPCIVKKIDGVTAEIYSFCENTLKSPLDCFEEAEALEKLIINSSLTHAEVAERLGMSQTAVESKLHLLRLGDLLKERVVSAGLSAGYVRTLLKLPREKREGALDKIIANGLSQAQAEALIKQMNEQKTDEKPLRKSSVGNVKLFDNSLLKLLNTLSESGFFTKLESRENENYIEYSLKLSKKPVKQEYYQIPFC